MKECYPVIIPTLNRYDHLRCCVESLAKNAFAIDTELVIGLDYPPADKYQAGYEKIKGYLPSITGFNKVTVLTTQHNLGVVENCKRLRDYVRSLGFDGFIFTEDDNEFSPNFLEYMNWGLNAFRDDNSILGICGFKRVDVDFLENNVYKYPKFNAWGCGFWFSKYEKKEKYNDFNLLQDWIDSQSIRVCFTDKVRVARAVLSMLKRREILGDFLTNMVPLEERNFIFPKISMVRNHGWDGSGIHGGTKEVNRFYLNLPIDTNPHFTPKIYSPLYDERLNRVYKKTYKTGFIRIILNNIIFILYKITGKNFS